MASAAPTSAPQNRADPPPCVKTAPTPGVACKAETDTAAAPLSSGTASGRRRRSALDEPQDGAGEDHDEREHRTDGEHQRGESARLCRHVCVPPLDGRPGNRRAGGVTAPAGRGFRPRVPAAAPARLRFRQPGVEAAGEPAG